MKFLLDNNLPPGLARALNELSKADHEVVALRDRFSEDTKDHVWMTALGREGGWAVITGDRLLRDPVTLAAWRESKLTVFFLSPGWADLQFWPKATKLVHAWPNILANATGVSPGNCYSVRVNGKLDALPPPS